jgi:hypothetical protein
LQALLPSPSTDLLPKVDQLIDSLTAHLEREEAELLPYL